MFWATLSEFGWQNLELDGEKRDADVSAGGTLGAQLGPSIPPKGVGCQGCPYPRQPVLRIVPGWAHRQTVGRPTEPPLAKLIWSTPGLRKLT